MANQRSYQSKLSYSQEHNQLSFNQYENRGNFGSQGRDYFSPSRQDDSENFGNQGRDYSSNSDRQDGRRNFGNKGRDYSSNSDRQDGRRNFGNQGRDYSSNHDRQGDRINFGNQSRDYSSNPDRQDGRRNFGNQGRDYSSNPDRQDGRRNFGYQGRDYSSNPARQYGLGNFGYQIGDEGYLMNQNKGTPLNKNEGNNLYKGRDYSRDNYASRSNQYSTSSSSIKLGNSCDEPMVFNDDRFSNHSQYVSSSQASNQQRQNKNQPQSSSGQFGQVKQNTFDDNKLPSGQLIQTQRGNFEDESNVEMGGNSEEGGNFEEEHNNDEQTFTNTVQDYIEDECESSDNEDIPEKVNAFVPSQELVEKFKYFPPSAEEMGNMFKELVIYFFYKIKSVQEKNPFVIICESFRRSDRFAPLEIEDGYNRGDKYIKYCTIRWNGIMMVRGVGYSGNLKEPRVVAAVELINTLAMSCYTLKMKDKYYSTAAVKELLEKGTDESDTVRIVQEHEAPDLESAKNYIINFFKDDNNHELLFAFQKYNSRLKGWAKKKGYESRSVHSGSLNVLGVSVKRFPQYWRDKILASGKMENERFELVPPQGMGKQLLEGFDITSVIGIFRKSGFAIGPQSNEEKTKYANEDAGLNIVKALPPWEKGTGGRGGRGGRRGGGRGGHSRPGKSTRHKLNRIERAIQEGQPEDFAKAYRHLNKKQKKKFRNNLNRTSD